jgi:hypothetical protein
VQLPKPQTKQEHTKMYSIVLTSVVEGAQTSPASDQQSPKEKLQIP